ncbi:MAG: hydantoinase/oxoprolinase family protein, partial [Candidatus Eremiobacteraeota bacterium]|nr:hydantoinase/oxoprolinase family protein [Candidatus Eremiobacteraeota bacterium]
RYLGQSFELTVPWANSLQQSVTAFHTMHRGVYGYESRSDEIEIVNLRVQAVGPPRPANDAAGNSRGHKRMPEAKARSRAVWSNGAMHETNVYTRESLWEEHPIEGPAVIEQFDSCTYLAPGWSALHDARGNLQLRYT